MLVLKCVRKKIYTGVRCGISLDSGFYADSRELTMGERARLLMDLMDRYILHNLGHK